DYTSSQHARSCPNRDVSELPNRILLARRSGRNTTLRRRCFCTEVQLGPISEMRWGTPIPISAEAHNWRRTREYKLEPETFDRLYQQRCDPSALVLQLLFCLE